MVCERSIEVRSLPDLTLRRAYSLGMFFAGISGDLAYGYDEATRRFVWVDLRTGAEQSEPLAWEGGYIPHQRRVRGRWGRRLRPAPLAPMIASMRVPRSQTYAEPTGGRHRPCVWPLVIAALVSTFLAPRLSAQRGQLFIEANVEAYRLGDIRSLVDAQEDIYQRQGIPVRRTSSFPTYPGGSIGVRLGSAQAFQPLVEVGVSSTGARLHYADYSGEVRDDLVVSRVFGGLGVATPATGAAAFRALARLRYSYSTLHSEGFYRLGDDTEELAGDMHAGGLSLSVEGKLGRHIGPLGVHLLVGGEYALGLSFMPHRLRHTFLVEGEPTLLRAAWTGVRAGVGVSYSL